jgi:hypothetical protein
MASSVAMLANASMASKVVNAKPRVPPWRRVFGWQWGGRFMD